MSHNHQFFIGGQWVDPIEPHAIGVVNPATEEVCGHVSLGSAADVDRAVRSARAAFETYSVTSRGERMAMFEPGEIGLAGIALGMRGEGDLRRIVLVVEQSASGKGDGGEHAGGDCPAGPVRDPCHDEVPRAQSVARKAISAFLSASDKSSPKRWPSFSTSAVQLLYTCLIR